MNFQFKPKSVILCFLYAIVLTGILLWVRFPSTAIKRFCGEYVETLFPGTDCTIGSLSYGFPLTLNATDIYLVDTQQPDRVLFAADTVSIRPQLGSPLKVFNLSGSLYGGTQTCQLTLKAEGSFSLTRLHVQGLDLQRLTHVQEQLERDITGRLTLLGEYEGNINNLVAGEARGKVEINAGELELFQPILTLDYLDMEKTMFDFQYREQELQIIKGKFDGKELNGNFAGSLFVEPLWFKSELDLKGDLDISASFLSEDVRLRSIVTSLQRRHKQAMLPFFLTGLAVDPLFRFGK